MTLLNVSFGIFAFMPQGWIFMVLVILIECIGLSYLLTKQWKNKRISITVTVSNIISGFIGGLISMLLNGGWWLVIWLPWVSDNEVNIDTGLNGLIIYYILAFLLTIIIETVYNVLLLKREYKTMKIVKSTLLINILTYLIGSIVMYSYSFG
jgi:hypothetical protein